MSAEFLRQVMRAALKITGVERAVAYDSDLQVVDAANIEAKIVNDPRFQNFAFPLLKQALSTGETILTNNIISDPAQAPSTNMSFSGLRVVVIVPIEGQGVLYLDQHIRNGFVERERVDRLVNVLRRLEASQSEEDKLKRLEEWV